MIELAYRDIAIRERHFYTSQNQCKAGRVERVNRLMDEATAETGR